MDENLNGLFNELDNCINYVSGKILDVGWKNDDSGIMIMLVSLLRKYHMKDSDIMLFLDELVHGLEVFKEDKKE